MPESRIVTLKRMVVKSVDICYLLSVMRNILLINPWIHDFAAYDFWNKPIGLLSLASFLRINGFDVYFLDCLDPYHIDMREGSRTAMPKRGVSGEGRYAKERVAKPDPLRNFPRNYHRYGIKPDTFLKHIRSLPEPDLVMVTSMMTYWYPAVFDVVTRVHQAFPGIPVVLGGNYVTLCPEHARRAGADFLLAGPGELSIPDFLKSIYNRDMSFIPDRDNLDSYPYPAFDLISHADHVPIMTSRGCPYDCSYCASRILNDRFRRRDPIRVADEIQYWHTRLGIRHFSFYDDALLAAPEEMAIPLFQETIRRDLPIHFHCPNGLHIRAITHEISKLLFKAGVRTIRFGFETSDPQRQSMTGGKVGNEELKEAVKHLLHAGYRNGDIGVYILCGLPGQSADEVMESIRFVQHCGARAIIAEYSPIPGTALWNDAVAASPYPIAEEPLFQNNSLLPCRSERLTFEMYQALKMRSRSAHRAVKVLDNAP